MMTKAEYSKMLEETGNKTDITLDVNDESTWPHEGAYVVCKMKNSEGDKYRVMIMTRGISLEHREKMAKGEAWNPTISSSESMHNIHTAEKRPRNEIWFNRDQKITRIKNEPLNPFHFMWKDINTTDRFRGDVVESYTPLHTLINNHYTQSQ